MSTKPATTYSAVTKKATSFNAVIKNATGYAANTSVASWLLNSTVVTLNSTLYRLNGYTTTTAPNQLGNKPATSYA